MSKIDIATNYAKALYDVCKANSKSEKVLLQLSELASAVEQINEKIYFAEGDVANFLAKFDFEPELKEALGIMANNQRFSLLPMVHEEFQALIDKEMNVIRGTVSSADELNSQQKELIEAYVNKTTNKKAILNYKVDSAILGGFIVDVGSMKMDGSLLNQLNNMKNYINNGVH
tara:strand:+ start:15080 stop:15598 length:519 start_codon:yes stop_codon:yes gene_type:complete